MRWDAELFSPSNSVRSDSSLSLAGANSDSHFRMSIDSKARTPFLNISPISPLRLDFKFHADRENTGTARSTNLTRANELRRTERHPDFYPERPTQNISPALQSRPVIRLNTHSIPFPRCDASGLSLTSNTPLLGIWRDYEASPITPASAKRDQPSSAAQPRVRTGRTSSPTLLTSPRSTPNEEKHETLLSSKGMKFRSPTAVHHVRPS